MPRSPGVIETLEIFDKISFTGSGFSPQRISSPSSSSSSTLVSSFPSFHSGGIGVGIDNGSGSQRGISEHERTVIDYHEQEALKMLHKLEYENGRKADIIRVMKERIAELEHELKDSNELGAIVIGLESQIEELQRHIMDLNSERRHLDAGIKALQRSKEEADELNARLRPNSTCSTCGGGIRVARKAMTSQQRISKTRKIKLMDKRRQESRAKHNKGFGFTPSSPTAAAGSPSKLSTSSSPQSPTKRSPAKNLPFHRINHEYGDERYDEQGKLKLPDMTTDIKGDGIPFNNEVSGTPFEHEVEVASNVIMAASSDGNDERIHNIVEDALLKHRLKDSQSMIKSLKEKLSKESLTSMNLTDALEKITTEKVQLEKQMKITEKKLSDKKRIADKRENDRVNEIELLKSTITELKTELSSTKNENKVLLDNRNELKKQITKLKGRVNDSKSSINDITREQKSEIEEITQKYEERIANLRSTYELQLQNAAHLKTNEVQVVGKKLERALSSDIESRESYETLVKSLNRVTNELNSALNHDINMTRNNPSPHSASALAVFTEYDRLQGMLLSEDNPMSLVSIFTYISRLLEQYVMLLKRESEEGHLVTRSLNFATNSRNVIKSLSSELKLANDSISCIDEFASSTLSHFERNGVVKRDELPPVLISSDGKKGSVKFDVDSRNKAFAVISIGFNKLINNEIVSVFEEANSFARSVMEKSPITSPADSPYRERRSRNGRNSRDNDHTHFSKLSMDLDSNEGDKSSLTMNSFDVYDCDSTSGSAAVEVLTFDDFAGFSAAV